MKKIVTSFILFLSLIATQSLAENALPEYTIKAAYLYNFALLTDWPEEKKSGDFNLCLFGKDNFGSAISALNNKSIGNQPIKIRSISDIEAVKTCHIVFISEIDRNKEQKIKQEISSLPVLLVTDNAQREHYHIAIIQDDERLSFTINIKALKEAHLNLSSRLLNLAKEVTE